MTVLMVMVPMGMTALRIGAWLGLERQQFMSHRKPHPLDHVVQHVVFLVRQNAVLNLQRNVAIPEVIGDPSQVEHTLRANDGERLLLGTDQKDLTLPRLQAVSIFEARSTLDEQPDFLPASGRYTIPRPLTLVEGQLYDLTRDGRALGALVESFHEGLKTGSNAARAAAPWRVHR
jgi:hypothetical protein